jgi:hypothetical protein
MNYGSISESIYNFREENGRTYHAVRFLSVLSSHAVCTRLLLIMLRCSTAMDVSLHEVCALECSSCLFALDSYVLPNDLVRQNPPSTDPFKQLMI